MPRLLFMGKQPDRMEGMWTLGSDRHGLAPQLCCFLVVKLQASALASWSLSSSSVDWDSDRYLSFRVAVRAKQDSYKELASQAPLAVSCPPAPHQL